ncbi:hypothetical protein IGI67_000238 [Enterococcus sp. AZ196]
MDWKSETEKKRLIFWRLDKCPAVFIFLYQERAAILLN